MNSINLNLNLHLRLLYLKILFLICTASMSLAETTYKLSGSLSIEKASLMAKNGIVFEADLNRYFKSGDIEVIVKDLYSNKIIKLSDHSMGLPIARSRNFDKLFLQNVIENKPHDIFIVTSRNNKTVVLDKITIPLVAQDPHLSNYYQFGVTNDDNWFVVLSEQIFYVYSLQNKKWFQLIELNNPREQLLELDPHKIIEYLPDNSGTFIVKKVDTSNHEFKTNYLKIRSDNLSEIEMLPVNNFQSFSTKNQNLITIDKFTGVVSSLNLINNKTQSFKISLDDRNLFNQEDSGFSNFTFYVNDQDQILALNKNGLLRIFRPDGSLEQTVELGHNDSNSIASNGSGIFIQPADSKDFFFYDIAQKARIQFPQILKPILVFSNTTIINNQFYFPLINDTLGSEPHLIHGTLNKIADFEVEKLLFSTSPKNIIEQHTSLIFQLIENHSLDPKIQSFLNSIITLPEFNQKSKLMLLSVSNFFSNLNSQDFGLVKKYLQSLNPYFKTLSESVRDQLAEDFSVSFTNSIRNYSTYEDVNPSKFANLVKEFLKPYFNLPSMGRTDLILNRRGNIINPQILGTHPIDGDNLTQSPFGFYMKDLPSFQIKMDEDHSFSYTWTHQNKTIMAQGKAKITNLSPLVNTAKSPSYEQLWSDKKLTGAFILSSNLLNDFEPLVAKIVSYYRNEGFNFGVLKPQSPNPSLSLLDGILKSIWLPMEKISVPSGKIWLQEQIQSGKLDYLVKEAHSGGNDEVVWLAENNYLFKGSRTLKNNTTEEVYILYPSKLNREKHGKEVPVSNMEFGKWIREREIQKGQELVFINASCWSVASAKNEIISARSTLLVEIPTNRTSLTFQNKRDNHERVVVDSIRKFKTYEEMSSKLEKIETTPNPYIFPNDSTFDQLVWSHIHSALDYQLNIQVKD